MSDLLNYENLFEYAACGLLVADSKGYIQKINSTLCAWLGYEKSSLLSTRRAQDLFTMGGRVFHQTHCSPLLQMQGSVAEVQMDLIHNDGHSLHTLVNIVRRKYADSYYDEYAIFIANDRRKYEKELLLARKSAEISLSTLGLVQQELQESRDVLGLAMRGAKMGVWTKNLSSKQLWCSRELEELAGLPDTVFLNTESAFYDLIHPDDLQSFITAIDTAVATSSDYVVEFRFKHSDGQWRSMEGRGSVNYNANDKPQTLFGVVIDISERQHVDAQLRQLNEKLSIADRRKDEFLATLAHELRNPLAPLRNVLEILKLKTLDDPELIWMRNVFERQVQQMTHLVDDLMEVSRITQGRLELRLQSLNLADVMQGAVDTAQSVMSSLQHSFTLDLPIEPIILKADATRLMQVISNLLTNAAKYTPNGGQILLSAVLENDQVVISVRDSGIGIAQEHLSHVFKMFSQLTPALERSEGGLGIGLALVAGIVKLHGGSVSAHSAGIGKGSEFVVRLPVAKQLRLEATAQALPLTMVSQETKILVIDDNVDAAESLGIMLELLGYKVMNAQNGLEGLALAQEFGPDFILLDIGLPDISGYDVARRIREAPWGKDIFIIAATGWGQEKDRELAKQAGFNHHLTKPIDFSELDKLLKLPASH